MTRAKTESKLDRISWLLFLYAAGLLIFGYGVAVGEYHLFPYSWLDTVRKSVSDPERKPHHLSPARYPFAGARIHRTDAMAPGVTLLTGFWKELDWKPGIRLIDPTGKTLHQWKTDPAAIWPKSPHADHMAGRKNTSANYVHGTYLFENGDILFNIEYLGLIRMNAKGDVLWKLPIRTHHSISRDESGNFWVCGLKWVEANPQGRKRLALLPGLQPPVAEDFAIQVSPEGVVLREISIVKALYESGHRKCIWQHRRKGDILHMNDVEPLPAAMADQYPLFKANDLLVSCRSPSIVFVIDIETEKVKWFSRLFLSQHDPDFTGDGRIRVFDNNTDGSNDGRHIGGSELVSLKPGEEAVRVLYPTAGARFYTSHGGKAQDLDNGHVLITEARAGRVFEIDRTGKTVWEWVAERYDDKSVPEVLEGTRYPITPEQVAAWSRKADSPRSPLP